jgi:hypothetical protein
VVKADPHLRFHEDFEGYGSIVQHRGGGDDIGCRRRSPLRRTDPCVSGTYDWSSCLSRLSASAFEIIQIPAGNY